MSFVGGGEGETYVGPMDHVLDGATYGHHLAANWTMRGSVPQI